MVLTKGQADDFDRSALAYKQHDLPPDLDPKGAAVVNIAANLPNFVDSIALKDPQGLMEEVQGAEVRQRHDCCSLLEDEEGAEGAI